MFGNVAGTITLGTWLVVNFALEEKKGIGLCLTVFDTCKRVSASLASSCTRSYRQIHGTSRHAFRPS